MEKLLKVNSSHAACVQASNGIMVMGKILRTRFQWWCKKNIFQKISQLTRKCFNIKIYIKYNLYKFKPHRKLDFESLDDNGEAQTAAKSFLKLLAVGNKIEYFSGK